MTDKLPDNVENYLQELYKPQEFDEWWRDKIMSAALQRFQRYERTTAGRATAGWDKSYEEFLIEEAFTAGQGVAGKVVVKHLTGTCRLYKLALAAFRKVSPDSRIHSVEIMGDGSIKFRFQDEDESAVWSVDIIHLVAA